MKKLITTLAVAFAALLAIPTTAEAGVRIHVGSSNTYVSGHSRCGCPTYTKRVFKGYDYHHRPIYRYYRVPSNCRCRGVVSSRYQTRSYGHFGRYSAPYRAGNYYRNRGYRGGYNSCRR